jgi:2-desacetyl-2-hydroxyethyl bacteriochlorophyllide A dehydrogenase
MSTMRAVVSDGAGSAELRADVPVAPIAPGCVRVTTRVTGISAGTESRSIRTAREPRLIPGYQNVGIVAEVGSDVAGVHAGDRVYTHHWQGVSLPPHPALGALRLASGAQASERVGLAASPDLVVLPEWVDDEDAAFLSVAAIGLHTVRRGGAAPGKRVLVTGLGQVGLHAVQGARLEGAEVYGLDRLASRLAWARDLGCVRAYDATSPDVWAEVAADGPFDVVIETTGVNALMDPILRVVAGERNPAREMLRQGTIVMVGLRDQTQYTFSLAHPKEVILTHTSHHTRADLDDVLGALQRSEWRIRPLVTHRLRPDEAPAFYGRAGGGAEDMLGAIVAWADRPGGLT